jgi:hypothetical protein
MQNLYAIRTRDLETGAIESEYEVSGHDAVFADLRNMVLDAAAWTDEEMETGMSDLRGIMPCVASLAPLGNVELNMPTTLTGESWRFEVLRVD